MNTQVLLHIHTFSSLVDLNGELQTVGRIVPYTDLFLYHLFLAQETKKKNPFV